MLGDSFPFVVASLAAAILVLLARRSSSFQHKTIVLGGRSLSLPVALASLVVVATVAILAVFIRQTGLLNLGTLIAILIGAAFGSFAARFIGSLYSSEFGKRDPLIGVLILLALSVGYSLPLYSDAVSEITGRIHVSSIKTPFLELAIDTQPTKPLFGVGAVQFNENSVKIIRDSHFVGLRWLLLDTSVDDSASTMPSDMAYIRFVESGNLEDTKLKELEGSAKIFLATSRELASCLADYERVVPNTKMLSAEVRPLTAFLFALFARAKDDVSNSKFEGIIPIESYATKINQITTQTNQKFSLPSCTQSTARSTDKEITLSYFQPYVALVLSDLLIADGSNDAAIAVLTEWLDLSASIRRKHPHTASRAEEWFQLRVASRVVLLLADLVSQNTSNYRNFFLLYKNRFESYFKSSKSPLWLDQLPTKCRDLRNVPSIEQKIFFLLLENEAEALRTEANFVAEEQKFDRLEELNRRARFLASVDFECLPAYFSSEQRNAIVADHLVTAGILGLIVADRMSLVAQSRGDRDRAFDVARDAERDLRAGQAELSRQITLDKGGNQTGDPWAGVGPLWYDLIFLQPVWERSYNLASRYMLQLRNKN
jgi:hypothetical protein